MYPRSAALVQTSRDVERNRLVVHTLTVQQKKDFVSLIRLQKATHQDYIEDGKLTWHDIFRPIIESTKGLTVGPLTRWFDNNCFYRQPIITGTLHTSFDLLNKYFLPITPKNAWKVTLPSPFLFAKIADNRTTTNFEKTLETITILIASLITYLNKKGVQIIQLNEPYIPYVKPPQKELLLFKNAVKILNKAKKNTQLAVHFYFGDAKDVVKLLFDDLIVDIVGIDFYRTNLSELPTYVPFNIIAGVIDGRNSLLEKQLVLERFLRKVIHRLSPHTLYVANNSDFELLPEPVAKEKVTLIGKIKKNIAKNI
jgi:5-methyltetrahydropteroyltriglutamate--homocysteine methyltransferase